MKRTAMVRKKPMSRGPKAKRSANQEAISQGMRFHWKKRKAAKPLVEKATGRRLAPKDEAPIYDEKHLALVRAQPCLVSGAIGCVAHHVRGLLPRTMGVRVTDFMAVSLRPDLHDGYGHSLHRHGNELEWWHYSGMPQAKVFDWIRTFLIEHYDRSHPGVAQALAKMAAEEARVTVTETSAV